MRTYESRGPFSERPFYADEEIERLARDELWSVDLLPNSPGPVRIERFIEKRFGVTPRYDLDLDGVLGLTRFGTDGVQEVAVARTLSEERTKVAERRINTTLAHEAGHGLLHAHLFALDGFNHSLFDQDDDVEPTKVLCRDDGVPGSDDQARRYDGRWWEYQANRVMGALLLPRGLVRAAVEEFAVTKGSLGLVTLPDASREPAAAHLSEVFDVNPVVGRIRLNQLYPQESEDQLTF